MDKDSLQSGATVSSMFKSKLRRILLGLGMFMIVGAMLLPTFCYIMAMQEDFSVGYTIGIAVVSVLIGQSLMDWWERKVLP
jgi:hypothetical protein